MTIDDPHALDAAIAASRHARRERLVRAVRNQRIRARVAYGLSACVAILALLAFFFADDHEAAVIIAMFACVTVGVAYAAGKAGHKKAVDALREMDQSM
jgi:1,4-dihydroxy-2-naphthoate octaprenyltransferase